MKDKEIYYVQSETRQGVRYRVHFEDGTCTCSDFKHREAFLQNRYGEGDRIMSRIHLSEEEVYDIFRNIFHNEEDALAATLQLFGGEK